MEKNRYAGKFIVFEGLDGSGKSTQADLLFDFLNTKKQQQLLGHAGVHITSEPTASLIGGLIRGQLSHDWKSSPETLQLLFAADRLYHLHKEIIPLLERGVTVLCDRYFFSAIAYGGVEIKNEKWLYQINDMVLFPDIVFFLKISPKICIQRIQSTRYGITLFEKELLLAKVGENYMKLAKKFPDTIHVINGEFPVEKIAKDIQNIYMKKFA